MLNKWKINPASIQFSQLDVTSDSSSITSSCLQAGEAAAIEEENVELESDSEVDGNGLTAHDRKQQELAQQRGGAQAIGNVDLSRVPLNASGEPSSTGSVGHANGVCKVCIYFAGPDGCSSGVACSFCHLPHKPGKRKSKLRPCKGKRDRYRKLLTRLQQQVEEDPDGFNAENLDLPPSISSNEAGKAKLVARMELLASQVKAARAGAASGASSSNRPTPATVTLAAQADAGTARAAAARAAGGQRGTGASASSKSAPARRKEAIVSL